MISRKPIRREGKAFTLIELLAVIAIIALLSLVALSFPNIWRSGSLTSAGNMVMEDMAYARELAVANNQPTEIWFLRPTGGTSFVATQIYAVDQNGISTSYSEIHRLPPNLGIDSGTFLSPVFVPGNLKSFGSTQTQPSISSYQTNYQAWFIRFMPDGSTTLPSTQQWFLALHDMSAGDQLSALPKNYAVVSIDPATGTVSLYRP